MTKKRRGSSVDEHAKHELELFVDNTEPLYRQTQAVEAQLSRVICRKKSFNVDLAARSYERVMMAGARLYEKEFSTPGTASKMFSAATRRELAKDYAKDYKQRVNAYLKSGTQDLSREAIANLNKCNAQPLAGRARRTRRKRR